MPLPDGMLREFAGPVFIETGSHRGDGIAQALQAGYESIYSCDVSPFAYGWCCHRFRRRRSRVNLFLMDSREFLRYVRSWLTTSATFWLDAHWCGGDGEMDGKDQALAAQGRPLLDELDLLVGAHVTTHTLLIDDVRMMGQDDHFPTQAEVLDRVYAINSDYRVDYLDGRDHPSDILVARVPPPPEEEP